MNPVRQKMPVPSTENEENQDNSEKSAKQTQHYASKYVELVQDTYGTYYDENGKAVNVERFTWRNFNKIQVQVITYGARIISIKMPDGKGLVSDVLLGLDDFPSYLADKLSFGAVIGRFANVLGNGTFLIDGREYWLKRNAHPHHRNGGDNGFDKRVWMPYVDGKRLILSYVSPHQEEGYPGDLFVRIIYELSHKNEFSIDIEAFCTKPTIINITNALYFNLAEHGAGPEELYKHMLTVNSNCFTVTRADGIPTGEIKNVLRTDYDFQVPTVLGSIINKIGGGFDQNLCVNRGTDQGNCFVARIAHPKSGKLVEIYSNQSGVQISTANNFGTGIAITAHSISEKSSEEILSIFDMINKLHCKMTGAFAADQNSNYQDLVQLIKQIRSQKKTETSNGDTTEPSIVLNPLQFKYLEDIRDTCLREQSFTDYSDLANVIQKIINSSLVKDPLEFPGVQLEVKSRSREEALAERKKAEEEMFRKIAQEELKRKGLIRMENKKASTDSRGKVVGKNGAVYRKHGAICVQTQNYPNAVAYKNFPNCILRPGETYKHTIVYKFWVKTGDPRDWLRHIEKRNDNVNFG